MRITTKMKFLCLLLAGLAMEWEQDTAAWADNTAYATLGAPSVATATPPPVTAPPEVQYSLPPQSTTASTPLPPSPYSSPAPGQVVPTSYQVGCGTSVRGGSGEYCEPFWYFSSELLLLDANFASDLFTIEPDAGAVGARFYLGREWASGFGIRTRFGGTGLESTIVDYEDGPVDLNLELNTGQFDVDLYRRFRAGSGSFLFGAGVSGAGIEFIMRDTDAPDGFEFQNIGAGLSVFAEGRHTFYHSTHVDWSVLSRGRWGYHLSETQSTEVPIIEFDSTLNVSEVGLGVEYCRKFEYWSLVVQYMIEAQAWELPDFYDVNYLGSVIRIGCEW